MSGHSRKNASKGRRRVHDPRYAAPSAEELAALAGGAGGAGGAADLVRLQVRRTAQPALHACCKTLMFAFIFRWRS